MKRSDLIILISNGRFDDMLESLAKAITMRRRAISEARAAKNLADIKEGDLVMLTGLRPKYLNTLVGTVQTPDYPPTPPGNIPVYLRDGRAKRYGPQLSVPAACVVKLADTPE